MPQNTAQIEKEWLTRPTGDPFADAGGFAIEYLMERYPEKDILELIEYVTKEIYIGTWKGKLHSYYHGSKITNPSIKTDSAKIEGTMKLFENIINERENSEFGFCRISGRETKLFSLGRESLMLAGSGGFVNFHHFFDDGLRMSKEITIRMFFMPLATILLQGKIALLHSNNSNIVKFWVKENCSKNLSRVGKAVQNEEEVGALKSEFTRISNALFSFVDKLFTTLPDLNTNTSLTLYHCSNFITKSELHIYEIPAKIFRFYTTCMQPKYKEDWLFFAKAHYVDSKHKGAIYNPNSNLFEIIKSKERTLINSNEFKQWHNVIYNNLLNNTNLRRKFLYWSSKHPFNFEIVSIYQQNIIGMKKETISKIKELAAFIVRKGEADKIKKSIKALDGAKNASGLRRFLLKDIVTINYIDGNDNTIITVDDYVNYLFPDGSYWAEIRDILLIAIYQELHERNLISEELKVELKSEIEEEATIEEDITNE